MVWLILDVTVSSTWWGTKDYKSFDYSLVTLEVLVTISSFFCVGFGSDRRLCRKA